jgi:hypothetical protein
MRSDSVACPACGVPAPPAPPAPVDATPPALLPPSPPGAIVAAAGTAVPPPTTAGGWGPPTTGPAFGTPVPGTPAPGTPAFGTPAFGSAAGLPPTHAPGATPGTRATAPGRRRSRRPLALLVLLLVAGAVAGGVWYVNRPADDSSLFDEPWTTATSPSGRMAVDFPGTPLPATSMVSVTQGSELSGSTLSIGGGGLDDTAVGAVFVETDATQLGLAPETVAQFAPAFLRQAMDGGLDAIQADPATDVVPFAVMDGGLRFRSAVPDKDLVLSGIVGYKGTYVFGIIVTVPAGDEPRGTKVLDRMIESLTWTEEVGG